MGEIHKLVTLHGRDRARDLVPSEDRYLVDLAAQVLGEEGVGQRGYLYSGFAMTCLPHRKPKDEGQPWKRQNGRFRLAIEPGFLVGPTGEYVTDETGADRLYGVPFGPRARLILLYLQSEAVKTNSPEVRLGQSMNDWMSRMGVSAGGTSYAAIRAQSERISACRITVSWSDDETGRSGFERANIVGGMMFMPAAGDSRQGSLWDETARLSPEFYQSLRDHPLPVNETAIRGIKNSSLSLDVYVWLCYRLKAVKKDTPVSWAALHRQFGSDVAQTWKFKQSFLPALKEALAVYPDARVDLDDKRGLILRPSRPAVPEAEARKLLG